jgi:Holliday junction resolvase
MNSFPSLIVLKTRAIVGGVALSNYEVGRRLEYRIRDLFRRNGYFVVRAAQSKPIDLVCLRNGRSVLVECKAGSSFLGKERKRELLELAKQAGAAVVLARRRRRIVELTDLESGRLLRPENLLEL